MTPQQAMEQSAGRDLNVRVGEVLAQAEPRSKDWLALLDYSGRIEDAWVAISTIIPPHGMPWRQCDDKRQHAVTLKSYLHESRIQWQCEIRRLDEKQWVYFGSGET